MATIFRAPLCTPRGSPSVSRVPHSAQADVSSNRRLLFGKDQFFAAPGMAPDYDWPNPLRRDSRFPTENRTDVDPSEFWILKDTFFGGPGQPPSPTPAQNPRGYPFPLDNRTGVDASEFWLFATTAAPFTPIDWPNPSRLAWTPETRSITAQSPAWTFQPPPTSDWPNPQPVRIPLENRTQVDGTEFWLLAPVVASPFAQTDWPNPRGPRGIDARTWTGSRSLLGTDQFFGAAGQPPRYDWPNPRGVTRSPDLLTEADGTEYWLLLAQAPFTQTAWPNPSTRRPAIDGRTHTASAAFVKPTAQTDWPNPQRPRLAIDARTAVNVRRFWFPAAAAAPFPSADWAGLPRRVARPLTWISAFPTRVLAAPHTPDPSRIFAVDSDGRVMLVEADPRTMAVDSDPRVLLIGPDTWSAQTHNHVFSALVFDPTVFDV